MTYREAIHAAMLTLAEDPKVVFVGYNIRYGSNPAAGTFKGIPGDRLIETPLAENLMTGVAIGLALEGYKPLVYFERSDFLTNAMDAIVNHLDKLAELSEGEFRPTMMLRVVVGNKEHPLYTGATHTQDFSVAMRRLVSFPVFRLLSPYEITDAYEVALHALAESSAMLFECKDKYAE